MKEFLIFASGKFRVIDALKSGMGHLSQLSLGALKHEEQAQLQP
jgi:hypothetical protein